MSKRVLSEGVLDKFFSLFLKAKSQNKQSQWLQRLTQDDPELGQIWAKWDTDTNDLLKVAKDILKKNGEDTSKIDATIKKYS
jgi:hypothetical protein